MPGDEQEPIEVVNYASRDQILAFDDRQYEVVYVPEWRTHVRCRGLTGTERDAWEGSMLDQSNNSRSGRARLNYADLRAKLIVRSVVDEQGRRIFRDSDVAAVGQKSAAALQRIFEVCQKLSRLTDEDVEELTQDFSEAANDSNGIDSPPISVSQ